VPDGAFAAVLVCGAVELDEEGDGDGVAVTSGVLDGSGVEVVSSVDDATCQVTGQPVKD